MPGLTIFLSLLFVAIQADYCAPWIAVDPKTIPQAQPGDEIDVYYMAAPLLYCTNLDEFTIVNGYHGGVGLVNKRAQINITLSLQGYPSFQGAFLPTITELANGTFDLEWQNGAKTFVYYGINTTYWHSVFQRVAVLNGTQFNQLVDWVGTANDTFTHYNPWFVYKSFPNEPLLSGFECFQFAIATVQKVRGDTFEFEVNIAELGAKMIPGYESLKVSVGTAYAHEKPIKVDFNDPVWNKKIVEFYLLLEKKWGDMGFMHFLKELFSLVFKGEFFVRDNDDYYYFKLKFPFFELHWRSLPIDSVTFQRRPALPK